MIQTIDTTANKNIVPYAAISLLLFSWRVGFHSFCFIIESKKNKVNNITLILLIMLVI
jgi:hypothetical protein